MKRKVRTFGKHEKEKQEIGGKELLDKLTVSSKTNDRNC